jgi:dual specificity protein kinase YAK1
VSLLHTYKSINPDYPYNTTLNPKRILTKPPIPKYNNGYDNELYDLILALNDIVAAEHAAFRVLDVLGQGTFGQVFKAQNVHNQELVALKVIKNKPAYFNQSLMEIKMLETINQHFDPNDKAYIIRIKDHFIFRGHLCIVLEMVRNHVESSYSTLF